MNNLSWRAIRAFIWVAEYGSFTAAANAQGLSKANLSQQVSELEANLKVQLLYRTTRQLRLTEIGEGYYQRCKLAMGQLDSAAQWASESTDQLAGVIKMNSVGGPIGEMLLAPLVIEFQRQHPGLEVHLDFSSVREDLITGHYDLVMRMGELPDSSLISRNLHTVSTCYVASPRFLREHSAIEAPRDLKGIPLIYGSVDHWILKSGKEQYQVQVEGGLKVSSGRVMRRAALAGLGVTRLSDVYVQADIHRGDLVEVLPGWAEQTSLTLLCPPLRYQLRRVQALMQWLTQGFERQYRELLERGLQD